MTPTRDQARIALLLLGEKRAALEEGVNRRVTIDDKIAAFIEIYEVRDRDMERVSSGDHIVLCAFVHLTSFGRSLCFLPWSPCR